MRPDNIGDAYVSRTDSQARWDFPASAVLLDAELLAGRNTPPTSETGLGSGLRKRWQGKAMHRAAVLASLLTRSTEVRV